MGVMSYGCGKQGEHGRRRVEVVYTTSVEGEKTPLVIAPAGVVDGQVAD